MKLNSFIIKTALMSKYRFRNQYVCVDEVHTGYGEMADVVVDTGKTIYEIEIKVSKSDLWNGEAKKKKHRGNDLTKTYNKYYICVPTELLEEARKWVEATNQSYGIIEFRTEVFNRCGYINAKSYCYIDKQAKYLNKKYSVKLKEAIVKRISSALITQYERKIYELARKGIK